MILLLAALLLAQSAPAATPATLILAASNSPDLIQIQHHFISSNGADKGRHRGINIGDWHRDTPFAPGTAAAGTNYPRIK